MTAEKPGKPWTTSSYMTECRGRISGMTARRIPGNSSAFGTSSRLSRTRIRSMQGSRTPHCSARRTAENPGKSSPDCASMAPARVGSRARAECACTRSFWIQATPGGCTSPFRRPARFARMMEGRAGHPSIGASTRNIFDPNAEVGHCVHHVAMHKSRPHVLFMQKHWDVMRSDNAGDSWTEVSGNLPTDFGFVIDVHAHEPQTIYVVPIKSDSEHFVPDGKLRVFRSRTGGNEWEPLTKGLPQSNCYVNILRDAMAVDSLDPCGVYFGTTGGQVYASSNAGDEWKPIVHDLPAVLSIEVQTLA